MQANEKFGVFAQSRGGIDMESELGCTVGQWKRKRGCFSNWVKGCGTECRWVIWEDTGSRENQEGNGGTCLKGLAHVQKFLRFEPFKHFTRNHGQLGSGLSLLDTVPHPRTFSSPPPPPHPSPRKYLCLQHTFPLSIPPNSEYLSPRCQPKTFFRPCSCPTNACWPNHIRD